MVYLTEELEVKKNYFVLDTSIWHKKDIDFAVYRVFKKERRGIQRYFVELKTNANNKKFPKSLRCVGHSIQFQNSKLKVYETKDEMIQEYCRIIKYDKSSNPYLFDKLLVDYPEFFV
jgi:hypothetical protein